VANSNPIRWFEICVQDMARARKLYESVFDARLERLNAGDLEMWAFSMAMGQPGSSGARVAAAGRTIHRDKLAIGQYRFIVLAVDTERNMIGLHSLQ